MPLMVGMLRGFTQDTSDENILFMDGPATNLRCPGAVFRRRGAGEDELGGEWVVEVNGKVVAAGGVLHHYNPPYGDVFMAVDEGARRQGLGSYLVQELRRVCHESGTIPSARCNPSNEASQRTLRRPI